MCGKHRVTAAQNEPYGSPGGTSVPDKQAAMLCSRIPGGLNQVCEELVSSQQQLWAVPLVVAGHIPFHVWRSKPQPHEDFMPSKNIGIGSREILIFYA